MTSDILTVLVVTASLAFAATPERSKGISVHMPPKKVAELGAKKWGFLVSYAEYLKLEKERPVLQSTSEVLGAAAKLT
ncbi:hypothetical protein [Paraburkholderia elongata]|uniref:hypothetical protein n=1 Tax=Paraburkholderia elongata TaxID=2675747 RepID=UPI001553C167|nr:hypothetical protein [Paraburkholderia elongata]